MTPIPPSRDTGPNALSWRERLHVIIFKTDTPAGRYFDVALIIMILLSVGVVMLDSVDGINARHGTLLLTLEWGFTALFTLEYLARIYVTREPRRYIFSFYGLVDLLAILPTYLSLLFANANYLLVIRLLRVLRLFRVLRLSRHISQANLLMHALRQSRQKITVFLFFVMVLVTIFGSLMYVIEGPANGFTSIPKSIYWAIVTLTTVGYGDIAPSTGLGQAVAALVMITGYSVLAVPTGIFTAELAHAMRPRLRHVACEGCGKSEHEESARYCNQCGSALARRPHLP